MKKILVTLALTAFAWVSAFSQEYKWVEASELNLIGKIMPDTPNPYHRVDTLKYKGFTAGENAQVRSSAGLAVLFRTDARNIVTKANFGFQFESVSTMPMSYRGCDLYIRKDGEWLWAGDGASKNRQQDVVVNVCLNMEKGMKECLLYLPIYSECLSFQIGVDPEATIEPLESPFRHRIAIFGSSYTHGISTTRAGMSYPMQFMRSTGMQILSLGCSGNCKMQPYFADVLVDVEADAFIFDSFSNPSADMIKERLEPFIKRLTEAHPGVPMIFQQTIYRERRNFNTAVDKAEQAKMDMAEKLMKEYCKKYKDVYFIHPDATSPDHEYSADGVHPDDYGYHLWEQSIEKPVLKILKKYGIR